MFFFFKYKVLYWLFGVRIEVFIEREIVYVKCDLNCFV